MVNIRYVSLPNFFIQIFVIFNSQTNTQSTKGFLWIVYAIISNFTSIAASRSNHRYPHYPWLSVNQTLELKTSSSQLTHQLMVHPSRSVTLYSSLPPNGIFWSCSKTAMNPSRNSSLDILYTPRCFVCVRAKRNIRNKSSPKIYVPCIHKVMSCKYGLENYAL